MKKKSIAILFFLTVILFKNEHLYAQCELPIPQGSHNLCNPMVNTTISNTSNTITLDNAGQVPVAGTCSITISYYDETSASCAPLINCSNASLSTSGSTLTLTLNGCAILPDLPNTAIFYLNIQTSEGVYFYHVRNFACGYVLGKKLTPNSREEKAIAVSSRGIKTPKVWGITHH
ncbi:hypothetical protein [Niastella sp. OAS944]|uniref:hypothetical protein n=1 Tax=Niastella sp. OAS944 TaxID=2664089 RepID=UPI00349407DC|nr:hypothetical protein [Chitinophagaceae bacterium OAS944]